MTKEEKIRLLLSYLEELRYLNEGVYHCQKEIDAVIKEINSEFGIK
jgi:hypothetical protein